MLTSLEQARDLPRTGLILGGAMGPPAEAYLTTAVIAAEWAGSGTEPQAAPAGSPPPRRRHC